MAYVILHLTDRFIGFHTGGNEQPFAGSCVPDSPSQHVTRFSSKRDGPDQTPFALDLQYIR
ncbi:hypothetical protein [Alicyclobacillus macrosporangiidus]|uniref:hypothetical protein n=1 Tax=Alicyclobacillus macrosporangiidus TaxID=392015 RepID=UPI001113BBE8|nr:hypothetical protein [Alicyclobacillus macrosporangiidus]